MPVNYRHLAALAMLGIVSVAAPADALYPLDASLADANGAGSELVAHGGTLGGGVYAFGANQGLSLDWSGFDPAGYAIALRFSFDDVSGGWRKIIDFKHLGSDNGLYVYNDHLQFVEHAGSSFIDGPDGTFAAGSAVDVVVTRDATTNVFSAWLGGVPQFSFTDSTQQAVFETPQAIANFFIDDFATGQGESAGGRVDFIRVSAVPLPAGAPLMLGALVFLRRCRA